MQFSSMVFKSAVRNEVAQLLALVLAESPVLAGKLTMVAWKHFLTTLDKDLNTRREPDGKDTENRKLYR